MTIDPLSEARRLIHEALYEIDHVYAPKVEYREPMKIIHDEVSGRLEKALKLIERAT